MKFRNLFASVAAAGLVVAPIAGASAGTRAGDTTSSLSQSTYSSVVPRAGSTSAENEEIFGAGVIAALIAAAVAAGVIIIVADDDDDEEDPDASPGT